MSRPLQTSASPELFPFQVEGSQWLSQRKHALLADEMGLGKSAQAIVAAENAGAENILVVCPAVGRINWDREFRKFSSERTKRTTYIALDGKTRPPLPPPRELCDGHITILSYELAARFHNEGWLKDHRWDLAVLDEAHFLKNSAAKRTQAVMGTKGLVRQADIIWALTGTPMPNDPSELWILFYIFGATKLTYSEFLNRYCNVYESQYGTKISGRKAGTDQELHEMFRRVGLRRLKRDVMKELPPISFNSVAVERGEVLLTEEEKEKVRVQLSYITEPTIAHLEALAGSVSSLRRYLGLQKVQACADLVRQELRAGAYGKIVIFAIHRDVVGRLLRELREFSPVSITGDTSSSARTSAIDRFQGDSTCRVFVGNIKAAGTSITLTAAHQVLFVEQEWTPGENDQAAMRCHRIGQNMPVSVRFAAVADSLDEAISGTLARKARQIRAVLGD